jgi:CHAT domain-containing protein
MKRSQHWILWSSPLVPASLLIAILFIPLTISVKVANARPTPQPQETNQEPASDHTLLTEGFHAERDLKAGEVHSFKVKLVTGQFLQLIVDQKGIDVTVTLFRPDGSELLKVDSPNSNQGPEPLLLVAETTGDFRLQVGSPNKASTGRYEIRVTHLRAAIQPDIELVAADRQFQKGQELRRQGTVESIRASVESYVKALEFFRQSGDRYREAITSYATALSYARSNDFRSALLYAEKSIPIFQSVSAGNMEGFSLNLTGGMHDVLGNPDEALSYYSRALSLYRELKDELQVGIVLNNIGKVNTDLAVWQQALEGYSQALSTFRNLKDRRREGIALQNLGYAYSASGEIKKGQTFLEESLAIRREVGDKTGEADTLRLMADNYTRLGEAQKALDLLTLALKLRRNIGDRRGEAYDLNSLGVANQELKDYSRAIEIHTLALEPMRSVSDRRGEAIVLNNLGRDSYLLRQSDRALDYYRQALSILATVQDKINTSRAQLGLAMASRDLGNLEEAQRNVEAAIASVEKTRSTTLSQQLRAAYFATMQGAYEFYIDLLMQQHRSSPARGFDRLALQINERARARSLLEMLAEAHVDIRQSVDTSLLKRERSLAQLTNLKAERLVQLQGQKNREEQITALNKEINALENEYRQVQAAIRNASPAYAALTQPEPLDAKQIQQQLDLDTALLEYSLGEERSYVWVVTPTSLTSFELPKRSLIRERARRVYELLTARSAVKTGETITQKRARLALADSDLLVSIKELSQLVLDPVASQLAAKRIVIVADDALQYVPFAALTTASPVNVHHRQPGTENRQTTVTKYRPLILDHEVVVLPSASTLAIQRKNLLGRKPAPNGVAVIADPVFSNTDERLTPLKEVGSRKPETAEADTRRIEHVANDARVIRRLRFTRQEAQQILAVAPHASNFMALDFKANRDVVTAGQLGRYRYLHFATHGYLDSERADLSALVLSLFDEQGNSQDGFLRAHEIYNLSLPAELVTLSACQTGLGKEIKGEGLVGLTRGFMYAGARRVVVSLWNVNDKATAQLMQNFYRGMLRENLTPAASLRKAQAEMSQTRLWQSPYYWAAFVLQGEWR